jgi:hypothetical protein
MRFHFLLPFFFGSVGLEEGKIVANSKNSPPEGPHACARARYRQRAIGSRRRSLAICQSAIRQRDGLPSPAADSIFQINNTKQHVFAQHI